MTPDLTGLTVQVLPPALQQQLAGILTTIWWGLVIWCGVGLACIVRLLRIIK